MKNKKLILLTVTLLLVLTACGTGQDNLAIDTDGGFWSSFNYYFSVFIVKISQFLGNNLVFGVIVSTLIVRGLMIPFYRMQMKSTESMQTIQPELKKIQEKYKNKTDQASKQKMALEQQSLYKKHGVNPFAGCLPSLLQMPVLFVYYGAIRNLFYFTEQAPDGHEHTADYFIAGYDLSKDFIFFGDVSDPKMIVLAVLAGVASYLSMWVTSIGQDKTSQSYQTMRIMYIIMPIFMIYIAYISPGAMAIYLTVSSLFTFVQAFYFRRHKIRDHFAKQKLEKNNK